MKVLLIDRNKITKYELPEKAEDSFVINYKPIGGKDSVITLEAENNNWKLRSNGSVNIMNASLMVNEVELVNYGGYLLKFLGVDNYVVLYAIPTVEKEKYKLDFSGMDRITIGSSENCNICYHNGSVNQLHAEIKKINEEWYINGCAESQYQTFLNNRLITTAQKLYAGDVIFINGFKLVWMKAFLQINNPNKQVTVAGLKAYTQSQDIINTNYVPVSDEEQSVELYNEDDYFFHIPRIKEIVEEEKITIDAPPASQIQEDLPFLLTVGSSITMMASTLMMGYNVGYGMMSGSRTFLSVLPQIVMCVAMLIGSLIMPRVLKAYQKKKAKEREELRLRKYGAYLDKKEKEIDLLHKKHSQILRDNSISVVNCTSLIMANNNRNFWSREINDEDFLKIRLGMGNIPSFVKIDAPKEQFTLDEDDLLIRVHSIVDKFKKLEDVPINLSLIEKNVAAVICSNSYKEKLLDGILLQLVALHSAADLKIVILTNSDKAKRWEYAKFLPHCISDDKSVRFFATNPEELKEVSNFLEEEFKTRKDLLENKKSNDAESDEVQIADEYKNFQPYYLIISDDFKSNHGIPVVENVLKYSDKNFGFSFLVFADSMKNLPTKIESFVEIGEKDGCILERNISSNNQLRFNVEYDDKIDMRSVSNKLLNVPLMSKEGLSILPTSLSFLEMYNVSKVEQLNILNRWKTNNPVTSLTAPVGVYANGEQFKLNLHEKFHGPHGLIAGSTGSGKSEFIITYILSMCVNYHPYEAQFVLIDYKGGGLAGAFENKETGVRIPHLAGTITNLDTAEMNRTLVSIESEMKRRQRIFNETRDSLGESTIDIYKYQRLYREGLVKEPLAHLFIISDEFAELKSQQPEFMSQLISTARIGRSLGVHLILATQKPSGVVNDQIWSNSKFKVCLKVQDRSDSMEMLKRPEAASIKETGRFYLQVGYDDFFDKGQSGWAGAKYVPSDRIIKKTDDAIDYINNVGYVMKTIKDIVKVDDKVDYGDQLTNIVKHIYNLGTREGIKTTRLWLDSIPEKIFIENVKNKYNYKPVPYQITPVIGEYDKPKSQEQGILTLDLTTNGNTIIWGQAGAGKENLLSTIIWSSAIEHTPDEVNFYIIDCGTEFLKIFNKFPHVGDIATLDDQEKIVDMLIMLEDELQIRKDLMADYGGSFKDYNENSGQKKPLIVTVINNYDVFVENYAKLAESIQSFYRDGIKYGIVFVVSAISTNAVKSRTLQNFNNKISLQLPNDGDYRMLLNSPKELTPSKFVGRGIIAMDSGPSEFQTAMISEKRDLSNIIREAADKFNQAYTTKARSIPSVPNIVRLDDIQEELEGLHKIPIGFEMESKAISTYNFEEKKFTSILSAKMDEHKYAFYNTLIQEFSTINNVEVNVIDLLSCCNPNVPNVNYCNNNYDNNIIELNNRIMQNKNDEDKKFVNIFVGIGLIKNLLSPNGRAVLSNLFNNSSSISNSYYIFMDSYPSYKNLQIESWYQGNIDPSYGIWLGEDVSNQVAISISNLTLEERKNVYFCMAYVVTRGQHKAIKHVVDNSVEV
jgi:type VII secretion protein EssC, C-terminal domain